MVKNFVPSRGDIVWINFDPSLGYEQGGHRPALVVSSRDYNMMSGFAVTCPITSVVKNYPFEVEVTTPKVRGVILANQFMNRDWHLRDMRFIGKIDSDTLNQVQNLINAIVNQ